MEELNNLATFLGVSGGKLVIDTKEQVMIGKLTDHFRYTYGIWINFLDCGIICHAQLKHKGKEKPNYNYHFRRKNRDLENIHNKLRIYLNVKVICHMMCVLFSYYYFVFTREKHRKFERSFGLGKTRLRDL